MASTNPSAAQTELSAQERFFRYFQHEITALQEQMARLGDTALAGGERKDATDHCLAGITRLSSEVKDASQTLPAYDLRTYSEAMKALQEKLAETQAQFAPKQKFAFKTKKNYSAISLSDAAELAKQNRRKIPGSGGADTPSDSSSFAPTPVHLLTPDQEHSQDPFVYSSSDHSRATSGNVDGTADETHVSQPSHLRQVSNAASSPSTITESSPRPGLTQTQTSTTVSTRTSSHIVIPASAKNAQSPCFIDSLRSCCVDLSIPTTDTAPFASLTINRVQSSLLLCGAISGPSHVTGVKDSIILLSTRQFRMHECSNVDVYLFCASRPIIEDCRGIRFVEMPLFYYDLLHPPKMAPQAPNLWNQIDDFKWLKAEQSPNWSILNTEDAIPNTTWADIIPSKPGWSVDDILTAVKITRK